MKAVQTRLSDKEYKQFMLIVKSYGEGTATYLRMLIRENLAFNKEKTKHNVSIKK